MTDLCVSLRTDDVPHVFAELVGRPVRRSSLTPLCGELVDFTVDEGIVTLILVSKDAVLRYAGEYVTVLVETVSAALLPLCEAVVVA